MSKPRVLVLSWLPDEMLPRLQKEFGGLEWVDAREPAAFAREVGGAQIVYGIPEASRLAEAPALRWVQLTSAGVAPDLCALARPHIYDPHWTLHAAAEQEYDLVEWAPQYQAGSRKPPAGRDRVRTELERTFEEVELTSAQSGA